MILLQRARLGMTWEGWILSENPEYFVTLTFTYPFGDSVSEEAMRFFVRALIRKLPRKKRHGFVGFVCAERVTKNARFEGCYHFHILLCDLDSRMEHAHHWLRESIASVAARIRSPTGIAMVNAHNTNVQRIISSHEESYAAYNTKDIYRLDRPAGCQILLIKNGEVTARLLTEE